MSEGGLDEVYWGATIQGMGGMGMTEPVRRNRQVDTSAGCRLANQAQHGPGPKPSAILALSGPEYRIIRTGFD
jgi:hypothetical protein